MGGGSEMWTGLKAECVVAGTVREVVSFQGPRVHACAKAASVLLPDTEDSGFSLQKCRGHHFHL